MAKDLAEARKDLEKEYADFRSHLGELEAAWGALERCNAEDDISGLLESLENLAHKVRTGGMLGSGTNAHARALGEYLELKGKTHS